MREDAIVAWRTVGGGYTRAERQREINQLRRELFDLLTELLGATLGAN